MKKSCVVTKKVLDRPLYWTGTEWHPDKERAKKYEGEIEAWLALTDLLFSEGYNTERYENN
mgnify:CR=1 FL=1